MSNFATHIESAGNTGGEYTKSNLQHYDHYTRPVLNDDDESWGKIPFLVALGDSFDTVKDSIKYQFNTDSSGNIAHTSVNLNSSSAVEEFMGMPSKWVDKPYFKDTRCGGNDAFNVQWGFNRDDDIVYPMMRTQNSGGKPYDHGIGMGRVYASTIERNQQILWLSFGVPRYTDVVDFYKDAFHDKAIKFNTTGSTYGDSLTSLISSLGTLAFDVVTAPFKFIRDIIGNSKDLQMNRFYELRTTMHLYYRYVDSMLTDWMVNSGLYDGNVGASPESLPLAMRETGVSIFDINALRARMAGQYNKGKGEWQERASTLAAMDPDTYDTTEDNEFSDTSSWTSLVGSMALGATQFVGFRIEKSTGSSESFSNATAPSSMAESINSKIREHASKRFDFGAAGGDLKLGGGVLGSMIEGVYSGAANVLSGAADVVGAGGLAAALTGGAFIDVPEQWTSSDFGKSYSVSFKLVAPSGDIESIRRSITIPLFLFLAGVLPRQAGRNSYSAPFLCRAYCKGMFSVPLGIVDSLSIERGGAEFGWTYGKLPTQVTVSMSIKDLSPAMYMAMHDKLFSNFTGMHNSFAEFMQTIAGMGLYERVNRREQLKRKMQFTAHRVRNDLLNPNRFASFVADTSVATAVGNVAAFFGYSFLPKN